MEKLTFVTDDQIAQFINDWHEVMNTTQSDMVFVHAEDQVRELRHELGIRHAYDTMSSDQVEVFGQWVEHFGEDEAAEKIDVITESKVRGAALLRGYRGNGREG